MKNLSVYLTYAGAIPFIFCAVCLVFHIQSLPLLGSVEKLLSLYALIISSFLAGAHWEKHLNIEGFWRTTLSILSNVVAILLWLGFVILSFKWLLFMFVIIFTLQILIDYYLRQNQLIAHEYFKTRCYISAIVITSLIISGMVS